jgi:uncharacterized protein (DUF2336 family)
MSAALPLFAELEDAMSGSSSERRTDVLRQVTDLFLAAPGEYSEVQSALFDDIIMRLAENIEAAAKVELARRLAPATNAPVRIIRALADDDLIDIAEPVLRQSERLSDADLVQFAKQKGPDHLLAISKRNSLSEAITDALLARDDHQVTRSVAENRGASFSDSGFGILVERSRRNDDLAESIARRHDIPPAHLRHLIAQASETVRRKLATNYPTGKIHEVLAEITGGLEAEARGLETSGDAGGRDYTAAIEAAGSLRAEGRLDDRMVYEFAKTGRFDETLAALSILSAMPIETLEGLMTGSGASNGDLIILIAKAAALTWPTAKSILALRTASMARQDLDAAEKQFERLMPGTARRVLRFHQVRQKVMVDQHS